MVLEILIDVDNAAFVDDDGELQRILAQVATKAQDYTGAHPSTLIRDSNGNGNTVGHWWIR